VKCALARNWRKFRYKFPRITVSSTTGIHKLIKKVRSAGSLMDKKPAKKHHLLTEEKLDEIGSRLENTQQKSLNVDTLFKKPLS
jgi:hypothetical protein